MNRTGCWIMATLSTGAALMVAPVPATVLGIGALAWLRAAAREASRDQWRRQWL